MGNQSKRQVATPVFLSMSTDPYFQHIINRINADVDFLVSQGVLSQADGRTISSKLSTVHSSGAIGSPAASAQTPAMPTPYAPPPTAPPVARTPSRVVPQPARSSTHQARALWGYNENGQVSAYCALSSSF